MHNHYFHLNEILYSYRKHENSLTKQISDSYKDNVIWKENLKIMFNNFCITILECQNDKISELLLKSLTYQKIDFEWIIINDVEIQNFKIRLKQNQNFTKGFVIEKVFLNKLIQIMVLDRNNGSDFFKSLYIIKKYTRVLNKSAIKTLIKYSLFK